MRTRFFLLSAVLISLLCSACPAQTTVAASLYGAFNQSTSGNGTDQSPANSAGGLIEVRHIHNPLFGYEATYSYNRANQGLSHRVLSLYRHPAQLLDAPSPLRRLRSRRTPTKSRAIG